MAVLYITISDSGNNFYQLHSPANCAKALKDKVVC